MFMRVPLLFLILSTGFFSCAGTEVTKVKELELDSSKDSKDIPKGILEKFQVQESTPAPTPLPAPSGKTKSKKPAPTPKKGAFVIPNRRSSINPVWVGEKMHLEITYLGMAAGQFMTEVLPFKTVNGRKVYHIKGKAESSNIFALFYRVNDWMETYWDFEGLFSHRFHLVLDQTKQSRDALELYDSEKKQSFYWNRRNHVTKGYEEKKETKDMTSLFPQDSFSILYYIRQLPLEDGKEYVVPVVSEGKNWEAVVSVVRREKCDYSGIKTQCIVVRPQTRFEGVLKQDRGDSFLWLTDDARRYLVRLEAKVKIGTVNGVLKKVEPGVQPE